MKIYDMHIHTGEGEPCQHRLLERMEQAGVYGGALISACPEEATANLYCLPYRERLKNIQQWTKGQETRLFPILWVHPHEKDACEIVKDAAQEGVRAFKIICDTFPVYAPENLRLLEEIEKTSLPVLFHTGILWSGTDSSRYNRPVDWECLLQFPSLKFSLAHCSWPWHDECIAVYGKFLNSCLARPSSEMFFDITPGTPKIYRKELLTKLYHVGYDMEDNILFGSDSISTEYHPEWVRGWLEIDKGIFDEIGVTQQQRQKLYETNLKNFFSPERMVHRPPQMNQW